MNEMRHPNNNKKKIDKKKSVLVCVVAHKSPREEKIFLPSAFYIRRALLMIIEEQRFHGKMCLLPDLMSSYIGMPTTTEEEVNGHKLLLILQMIGPEMARRGGSGSEKS